MWMSHTALSQGIQYEGAHLVLKNATKFLPSSNLFEAN